MKSYICGGITNRQRAVLNFIYKTAKEIET